eukprot:9789436-Lingulodinium_polyedra.AAC.1
MPRLGQGLRRGSLPPSRRARGEHHPGGGRWFTAPGGGMCGCLPPALRRTPGVREGRPQGGRAAGGPAAGCRGQLARG